MKRFQGGLLVGGLLLVEQDSNTRYWNSIAKYVAAEGIVSGQGLLVVGAEGDPRCVRECVHLTLRPDACPQRFLENDVPVRVDSLPKEEVATQVLLCSPQILL